MRKLCSSAAASMALAASALGYGEDQQKVQQLEARIVNQQQELAQLQDRLVSLRGVDQTDQARASAMREQIRAILSEKEFRDSLAPSSLQAGYNDGFYIGSSDENFQLKVNGVLQFRWTSYGTRSDNKYRQLRLERNDRTGFDLQRTRVVINGYAYSKDLTYHITLRSDAPDGYDTNLHYAWVNYRFADEFQIRAGIFRLASTRAQVTGDQNFQGIDRPLSDAVFGLGIGTGVRFWGRVFDKQLDWYLDVVNSLGSPTARTITPDPAEHDNNPAILAKLVWHALQPDGEDGAKEFATESDLKFHEQPALDIGMHYAFNEDDGDRRTLRIPFPQTNPGPSEGGFGLTNTNGLQINQFGWDAAFKWHGFSIIGEYVLRIVDPRSAGGSRPWTNWWLLTGDDSTTAQHGAYVQAGYFLPIPGLEKKIEAYARVGGISTLAQEQEGTWEYAGGLNYFIEGHKVKLQTEVTKVSEVPISSSTTSLANVNDDALIWRVQMVVAF